MCKHRKLKYDIEKCCVCWRQKLLDSHSPRSFSVVLITEWNVWFIETALLPFNYHYDICHPTKYKHWQNESSAFLHYLNLRPCIDRSRFRGYIVAQKIARQSEALFTKLVKVMLECTKIASQLKLQQKHMRRCLVKLHKPQSLCFSSWSQSPDNCKVMVSLVWLVPWLVRYEIGTTRCLLT